MQNKKIFIIVNCLTAFRPIAGILTLLIMLKGFYVFGLIIFMLAVLTEMMDGYLARKFQVATKPGQYFDGISDFIWLIFSWLAIFILDILPFWIFWLILIYMFVSYLLEVTIAKRQKWAILIYLRYIICVAQLFLWPIFTAWLIRDLFFRVVSLILVIIIFLLIVWLKQKRVKFFLNRLLLRKN